MKAEVVANSDISVLLQQQKEGLNEPALHVPTSDIDVEAQLQVPLVSIPPTRNSVQASPQPTGVPKKSPSRLRFIVDGVQLIIFTILTLLGVAIILIIMCFYLPTMLAFPFFVCIPSLCMGKKTGWAECNGFWKDLLYSVWAFIRGLWD